MQFVSFAMENFNASPEHYKNIIDPDITIVGFGIYHTPNGFYYNATQVFR